MLRADEGPFLEAALARPDADGPRLVYADFLEQSDDPAVAARGELIRVQLALSCLPEGSPQAAQLAERQEELRQRYYEAWVDPLRGFVAWVGFRRGIPDMASIEATEFLERGDELFQILPIRWL